MLSTREVQGVFSHIKHLHPHCPADKVPKLTQEVADAWARGLDGYTVEEVYKAAEAHARSCRFWPSLSEIVKQLPARPVRVKKDENVALQALWCKLYHEMLDRELALHGLKRFEGTTGAEYATWQKKVASAGVDTCAMLIAAHQTVCGVSLPK